MAIYFVTKKPQANGDQEVHKVGCALLLGYEHTVSLGEHATCVTAVMQAKTMFPRANGCYFCSSSCHRI